jgi:hypothetical protein
MSLQRIKTSFCCVHCSKNYTRKSSYTRHTIVCEILHQTKRERKCREEETTDIPTLQQMYIILQEMVIKNQALEEKVNEMQKWVHKTKQTLNVIQWLNTNIKPIVSFEDWTQTDIQVSEEDIQLLFDQPLINTIQHIFRNSLQQLLVAPIYCFSQKANVFYCFAKESCQWMHLESAEFIMMLKRIHQKMVKALCDWSTKNADKINKSDKLQLQYNKTLLKLMNIHFTYDSSSVSKIKSELFHHIKKDLKNIIEYEYEF